MYILLMKPVVVGDVVSKDIERRPGRPAGQVTKGLRINPSREGPMEEVYDSKYDMTDGAEHGRAKIAGMCKCCAVRTLIEGRNCALHVQSASLRTQSNVRQVLPKLPVLLPVKIPFWVFLLIAALYCCAFRVDIMDVDASQYAEISREMSRSGDFLHVFDRGYDYLDKPPFLFWITALSMKVFGATNFAYRLPSLLFALLAIYATYRLTRLLYNERVARIAALVLATSQGFFLWTNDVRTDMVLTGCVAAALWCIRECEQRRRWAFVLGGTLAIACGMMTKGPIALFVPLFAFGSDWLLRRKWRQLFSAWHLPDAALIALFLVPMCIGLYQQFDLHPEKWIEGRQGTSGLRFFFWTQSFGRITGENSWDNGADPFFLLSSMGWAFLPWILLFLTGLFISLRRIIRQKFRLTEGQEGLSTGGFVITYLSLCISHYQLPHYILVAFPLAAIIVGKLLHDFVAGNEYPKLSKAFAGIQTGITGLLLVGALLILTLVFPAGPMGIMLWTIAAGVWMLVLLRTKGGIRVLWISAVGIMLVNFFLTSFFYYPLLKYQVGSTVGKYIRARHIPQEKLWAWRMRDPLDAIHFYSRMVVRKKEEGPAPGEKGTYLLLMRDGLSSLDSARRPYVLVKEGRLFKVSEVTPQFLNHSTRDSATQPWCLVLLR